MRKVLLAVLLLVVVSTAHAGFFQDLGHWLFGRPEYTTVLKDGSAEVSLMAFSDPLLRSSVKTGYMPNDPSQTVHVLKTYRGGWYLRGLVNFTNGSGATRELDVELDSSSAFFRPESVPSYGANHDAWLMAKCARSISPETGMLLPFVSWLKPKHGPIQGPVYFVLDVSQLPQGPHKLYVRTMVCDQDSKLNPSEPTINLYVDVEGTPEGDALMRQQFRSENGDVSNERLDDSPPPTAAPRYTPPYVAPTPPAASLPPTSMNNSFQLLDDAPEIRISDTAELAEVAAQVGYTGPLGRRASFRLNSKAVQARTNVVLFFTNSGSLVCGRKVGIRFGSTQRQATISDRGYLILKSGGVNELPLNEFVDFFLEGLGRVITVEMYDANIGYWLPMDITNGRAN